MLSRLTMAGPSTGYFQIPVYTALPCHGTSLGRPTFTDSTVGVCGSPAAVIEEDGPGRPPIAGPECGGGWIVHPPEAEATGIGEGSAWVPSPVGAVVGR